MKMADLEGDLLKRRLLRSLMPTLQATPDAIWEWQSDSQNFRGITSHLAIAQSRAAITVMLMLDPNRASVDAVSARAAARWRPTRRLIDYSDAPARPYAR